MCYSYHFDHFLINRDFHPSLQLENISNAAITVVPASAACVVICEFSAKTYLK